MRKRLQQIDNDPDLREHDALALIFRKFAEFQSARQVLLWFLQEKIVLPLPSAMAWKADVWNGRRPSTTQSITFSATRFTP